MKNLKKKLTMVKTENGVFFINLPVTKDGKVVLNMRTMEHLGLIRRWIEK